MLTPIEVEALHDEWARIERIHREVVAKPDREERLGYYLRLLEEDHLHPGSLVGVATTTDDFALAGGCVATLLDMGMRMPFVNQLAAHVLGHDPALWPLFEPYRDNPKPTISAAMIVRDEEAVLGDCLSALLPFVDQCVVVDTGSVDGTVEIADSYGVEVHHHPWENDYGLARNQSLEYVTSDWVIWIDADEVIDDTGWRQIHENIKDPEAQAIQLRIINDYGNGEEGVTEFPRVWRHDPRCVLRWPFYEDISWAIYPLCSYYYRKVVDLEGCRILHDGYLPENMERLDKYERNERMMAERVESDPRDTYARVHYAEMLKVRGKHEHAVPHFAEWSRQVQRAPIVEGDSIGIVGFAEYGECLADLGRYDQGLMEVRQGETLFGEAARLESARRYIAVAADAAAS